MDDLLLHCCCAPCAIQPIESLLAQGWRLRLYFGNSNIQPESEHQRRLETLVGYAAGLSLKPIVEPYRRGEWFQDIGDDGGVFALVGEAPDPGLVERRRLRCRLCYRHRLTRLAATAARLGVGHIASTLAVSPYQHQDILQSELQAAAAEYGLQALYVDWRPLYARGQEAARRLGLYRQRYCGCEFSRQEALLEEAARASARQGR